MFDIQAAIAAAAATGPDMNEAKKGGGDGYTPPAAGLARLRFVGYIELGQHKDEYQGQPRIREKVALIFELSGPKHPPKEFDGQKEPHIITITETLSLSEKANFYKLFKRMNHDGKATHMAQLLGRPFLGTVIHYTTGEGANAITRAKLRDDSGYTIRPPFVEDVETGESKVVEVSSALTPLKCFIWNSAAEHLKGMWDSIFIDGEWPAVKDESGKEVKPARSKNHWQLRIRSAENFSGSPMAELLFAGGVPDIGDIQTHERKDEDVEKLNDTKAGVVDADPLEGVA